MCNPSSLNFLFLSQQLQEFSPFFTFLAILFYNNICAASIGRGWVVFQICRNRKSRCGVLQGGSRNEKEGKRRRQRLGGRARNGHARVAARYVRHDPPPTIRGKTTKRRRFLLSSFVHPLRSRQDTRIKIHAQAHVLNNNLNMLMQI